MTTTGTGAVLPHGPGAATGLDADSGCVGTPPRPLVTLGWSPSGAGPQRVDVATTGEGLATGNYLSSEELPADASTLRWEGAQGEAEHHWRVLTRTAGGWVPSVEAVFAGPGCVGVDMQG